MTHIIDTQKRPLPKLLKGSYYLTQPRKPWLVNGIIREGTTVFISGKEGTGKSFVGLELLACIAEGRDFFGNKVSQGEVIYVAAERGENQSERIEALRDLKGTDPDSFNFFNEQFKFNLEEDEQRFIEAVEVSGVKPKVVLIDTLRASFEGDENSSAVAQTVMDAFARCKKRFDTTFIIIHHVNAFGQSRGSSAFIGAADTELYVTNSKATGRVFLTVRKQNNGRNWTKLSLLPQEIQFGNDYSSIVLNLESENVLEELPEADNEDATKDNNIIAVVEQLGVSSSIYKLTQELKAIEGTQRNNKSLKKDLERLAKQEKVRLLDESDGTFKVAPIGND